ncbi:hypothetical protein [Bacillus sp. Marseille-P3800]|uniref:hypothetical protein n=1 Tax=Bacillus sp. Marseille-P3800 TaxID=2014782 RepID=UPI000C06C812|nr:hypothetical protein [Bacillus sp. Marseille-P3800]
MSFFVTKAYDSCCDKCGLWFGAKYELLYGVNKKESIEHMMEHGWVYRNKETLCNFCASGVQFNRY